jgi:hypothetical protein
MSISGISSVSAPAAVSVPDPAPPKAPDVNPDGETNDAGAAPRAASPPLPPGQGMRIDQLC